jgi:hypothetical protein
MGTSKHVVVLLAMTLGGLLAAGQDQTAASAPSSQPKASNTRSASCIVRITVDPTIMPLSLENIESLLHSSGVAVKAGREVLGLNEMQVFNLPLLKVEWLNASSVPRPSGARSSRPAERGGYDAEMARQMEEIYGPDYMRQMMGSSGEGKKEGAEAQAAAPPQDRPEMTTQRSPGESDAAYRARLNQMRVKAQQKTKARGVQGIGGTGGMGMGGMGGMGVGGMGGYGGGMAGRMGGYGGMGFYGAPGPARQGEGVEQTATVKLVVDLPENVPPRADEFLQQVIGNFQNSLFQAYEAYVVDLRRWLNRAGDQRHAAEAALEGAADDSAATQEVRRRLDTMVDLSALNPQMPLNDAVELLKKSVDPPLNIVVLWKDVETNLLVQPSSPTNFEGSPRTKLRTALDLLVKGLYDGSAKPMWKIRDDTIVIGTAATLGQAQEAAGQSQVEADAVNLAGERSELARRIQALELDLAGLDARQKAVREQIAATQAAANQRLAEDSVTRELQRLLATSEDTLAQLKKAADAGRASMVDVSRGEEGVAKARIDLARRQEELTRQAGGGQLEEFTKELSRMAIDKAEKEAQLQIVRKQLDEVQKQLMQALTFDPEAARLRLAQEALDITGRRVAELQTQIANLQPPTVLVIGAN